MKKSIRIKLLAGAIILLAVITQIIINTYGGKEDRICQVFLQTNPEMFKSSVNIKATMEKEFMTADDIKRLMVYMSGCAGVSKKEEDIDKKDKCYELICRGEGIDACIRVYEFDEAGKYTVTFLGEYTKNGMKGERENAIDARNALVSLLEDKNMKITNNSLVLEGEYPGCLSNDFIKENTKDIYRSFGVEEYSVHAENGMYISYGYSDFINENIVVGKEKTNLNIVYTYDEKQDKTCIYVATPIINSQY